MHKARQKSFTLIEMLMVLGIISILAVVVVVAINPIEAQKKSRDTKRLKDAQTLTTLIQQFISDGGTLTGCLTSGQAGYWCTSMYSSAPQTCNNNWLQQDFCAYSAKIPIEQFNGLSMNVVSGGTVSNPNIIKLPASYFATVSNGNYEVGVYMESKSNADKIFNDGGNSTRFFEVGNDLNLIIP